MKGLQYKIVTHAPVEAVVALYKEAGWWKESARARAIIPAMIKGSFCFMVAQIPSGEIVAMGRVISDGISDAYIQDVVVCKNLRGRGVGREMVSRLTQYCKKRRLPWIGLVAEPGTRAFYQQLGYKELRRYVAMRQM